MMKAANIQMLIGMFLLLLLLPAGRVAAGPKLVCDTPAFQFGRVAQSAVVTNVFLIRNEGDTTFVAGMPRATCGCTKVRLDKRMIGPGETAGLTAVFTAERRSGEQRKAIYLPSSDSEVPAAVFYMQGFVEPPAESH